jgi:hypothetical protein
MICLSLGHTTVHPVVRDTAPRSLDEGCVLGVGHLVLPDVELRERDRMLGLFFAGCQDILRGITAHQ